MHEIITLKNGVRVIYEKMPAVRSAALGIFIGVGSRNERASENGSAHYIEHMLFKSSSKHSAAELAFVMDSIGGQINAYTTRESTCFYAKVLDTHLDTAIDLLAEMFFDCAFDENETDSERGVILEEIGMYEDTPDDVCFERLMSACYKGALGRSVLGKPSTLCRISGSGLKDFKNQHYTAEKIVISLCGSFRDTHLKKIRDYFSGIDNVTCKKPAKAEYSVRTTVRNKKTEQNQFCIAFPTIPVASDERFTLNLLSTILGGGVSSRLFQNIREKYGLCYSIFTFQSNFSDAGILAISTAVGKETELRTLELIGDELRSFIRYGVLDSELSRAREQAKSSLVMGLESSSARMIKLGNSMLALGKCLTTDELILRYDAVTANDILHMANKYFDFSELSLSVLGKARPAEEYKQALGL